MTGSSVTIDIYQIIDEVRRELNPDGGGYDRGEAVNLIHNRVKQRWPSGHLTPAYEELVRLGIRALLEDLEDMEAKG